MLNNLYVIGKCRQIDQVLTNSPQDYNGNCYWILDDAALCTGWPYKNEYVGHVCAAILYPVEYICIGFLPNSFSNSFL